MRLILSLFLLILGPAAVLANDTPVRLDVMTTQSHAVRGQSMALLVKQEIAKGWHTYWTNPGDAGQPIDLYWNTRDGLTVSDLRFPTPQKIDYEGLVDFGYRDQAIYTAQVFVPQDYKPDVINLTGNALMLVCKDICIPVNQEIRLKIPVRDGDATPINADIIQQAEALFPKTVNWNASLDQVGEAYELTIFPPITIHNQFTDVSLYPYDYGVLNGHSLSVADIRDDRVIISHAAGDRSLLELPQTKFLIKTANESYVVEVKPDMSFSIGGVWENNLFVIMIFAFIGGMILNLMPCVFPVLSMKALSLIKLSDCDQSYVRKNGLAYTAGIIISMWCLAGLLIALKTLGAEIGWGFQLQNPFVTFGLAILFVLLALNLWGVFHVEGRFTSWGSKLTWGNDANASFFTGVLAMLVSTPCSAPFMATAIGFALTQSALIALIVFSMLGFGLAFPYLLLCFVPKAQCILPKPGSWMNTFKRVLAVPMIVSAIWLFWVFAQQAYIIKPDENTYPFDRTQLIDTLDQNPNNPVFVNMTAAWCITCIVNENTSLSSDAVQSVFQDHDVIYIKGDWTNYDPEITAYLREFGRDGVPLYVYYAPVDAKGMRPDPVVLPQVLTSTIVTETIKQKDDE